MMAYPFNYGRGTRRNDMKINWILFRGDDEMKQVLMIIIKEQKTYEIHRSHMTRDISDLMLNSSEEVFMYFIHELMINERIYMQF